MRADAAIHDPCAGSQNNSSGRLRSTGSSYPNRKPGRQCRASRGRARPWRSGRTQWWSGGARRMISLISMRLDGGLRTAKVGRTAAWARRVRMAARPARDDGGARPTRDDGGVGPARTDSALITPRSPSATVRATCWDDRRCSFRHGDAPVAQRSVWNVTTSEFRIADGSFPDRDPPRPLQQGHPMRALRIPGHCTLGHIPAAATVPLQRLPANVQRPDRHTRSVVQTTRSIACLSRLHDPEHDVACKRPRGGCAPDHVVPLAPQVSQRTAAARERCHDGPAGGGGKLDPVRGYGPTISWTPPATSSPNDAPSTGTTKLAVLYARPIRPLDHAICRRGSSQPCRVGRAAGRDDTRADGNHRTARPTQGSASRCQGVRHSRASRTQPPAQPGDAAAEYRGCRRAPASVATLGPSVSRCDTQIPVKLHPVARHARCASHDRLPPRQDVLLAT